MFERIVFGCVLAGIGCAGVIAQTMPPPAVSVMPVVSRPIAATDDFVGRVVAVDKADVVTRIPGVIAQRNFTEGQLVRKGDLLFRLKQDNYKAAVERCRANLAKAMATEVNAALELQRAQEPARPQNVSQAAVDQLAAAERAAQAEVKQAEALLKQARLDLDATEIVAPIDGRIGVAVFAAGNFVEPSSGKLATIVSQDPIYVTFPASEADIIAYRRLAAESKDKNPQVTVHLKLPNGRVYQYPGVADFSDARVQADSDTVMVRAKLPNPEGILMPGGTVGVVVDRGGAPAALVVPRAAVQRDRAGNYVLIVDAAGKVDRRPVTTGAEQGRDVVVTDGVATGERVIVEGLEKVHPGQIVTPAVVRDQ